MTISAEDWANLEHAEAFFGLDRSSDPKSHPFRLSENPDYVPEPCRDEVIESLLTRARAMLVGWSDHPDSGALAAEIAEFLK